MQGIIVCTEYNSMFFNLVVELSLCWLHRGRPAYRFHYWGLSVWSPKIGFERENGAASNKMALRYNSFSVLANIIMKIYIIIVFYGKNKDRMFCGGAKRSKRMVPPTLYCVISFSAVGELHYCGFSRKQNPWYTYLLRRFPPRVRKFPSFFLIILIAVLNSSDNLTYVRTCV